MSRKKARTHVVTPPREETLPTIKITPEMQRKAEDRARRQQRIENGILRAPGTGAHGGSVRQNNRRQRRRTNEELSEMRRNHQR